MTKDISLTQFVADRIKSLRKEQGISQEALSEKAGLDVKYVNKLENFRLSPRFETVESLLNALGITYSEFFNFEIKTNQRDLENLLFSLSQIPQGEQSKKIKAIKTLLE